MALTSRKPSTTLEATVTSKGQVTLPSKLRKLLGLEKGSRIRFHIPASGPVELAPVRFTIEDLWRMSDARGKPGKFMSFDEMNESKTRRKW